MYVIKTETNKKMSRVFRRRGIPFAVLALIVFLSTIRVQAAVLSRTEIREAAQHFVEQEALFRQSNQTFVVDAVQKLTDVGGTIKAWAVHLQPLGFVLLSADSNLKPVLGFSMDSRFTGRWPTLDMLLSDVQNREKLVSGKKGVSEQNRIRWQRLIDSRESLSKTVSVDADSIYYFPTPVWGQGYVNGNLTFNYYTPNHWSTGCVATAMAEVLAYYRWPVVGTGTHCYYEDDAGQLCAAFDTTHYDWPNILDIYKDVFATTAQRKAAGLLSYHTSISVNMDFESNGSTAETADAPNALHNYFRCSGHYKSVNESGFWSELENNMKDARPVLLSIKRSDGLGHSVVVDGFAESNGYYHLNMGWDGDDNGFYDISGTWNAGGYTIVIGAAKGIVPNPMIEPVVQQTSEKSFILSWQVSPNQKAEYYELQQATALSGPWTTLNAAIADTFWAVSVPDVRNYYYRVRARRDGIWWDWSAVQKISLGGDRKVTFNVDMRYQTLEEGDSLVLRGNIPPLYGSQNSRAFMDADSDKIYSLTLGFDLDHAGEELSYRFAIAGPKGTQMEAVNRSYVIGWEEYQNLDTVYFDNYVSIEPQAFVSFGFNLMQNYPNPFNPATVIRYEIPGSDKVDRTTLSVYNVLGQLVRTLVNTTQNPGKYSVPFNASGLPSGIYYYTLRTGRYKKTRKMLLLQ